VRAVNRVVAKVVKVVQVGSREAVAVRRVAKAVRVAVANRGAAGSREAARRVVDKGVRVAEAVRAQVGARGNERVAGRAGLVDVKVGRELVRGKSWS
jgi:hypothetical protein